MQIKTTEQMQEILVSMEQLAREAIETARKALGAPQNAALLEEIHATSNTATELLVVAEVGQWASIASDKQRALDRAIEIAQALHDRTRWMLIDLSFLHEAPKKQ